MGLIYGDPPTEATRMLREIVAEFYPPLANLKEDIDVRIRFVESEAEGASPLKVGGWPADAVVSVVPLRHRACGGPDVLIEVDAHAWEWRSERQRRALLHHELHHIDVVDLKESRERPGVWLCKLDTCGRPKVKLRPHDWQLGGFRELAELYEEDAPEVMGLRSAVAQLDQGVFDFARAPNEPATLSINAG
jgi:hypothetical protein